MPRNSSGTYTLPAGNPVVANTLIETSWANPTMSDIGSAITDSLDRNGRGAMLAPLLLPAGSESAPALAFSAESTSGLYRSASSEVSVSIAGTQRQRWTTTFAQTIGNILATGSITATSGITGSSGTFATVTISSLLTVNANAALNGTSLTVAATNVTWSGNPTHTGNHTFSGNVTVNGNTVIGNQSTDTLTITPNAITWASNPTHSGDHAFSGQVSINGGAILGNAAGDLLQIGSSAVSCPSGLNFDSNTLVIDAVNDRVGVGMASPAAKLDVDAGSSGLMLSLNSTSANGGYARFTNSGTAIGDIGAAANIISGGAAANLALTTRSATPLIFGTNATERARIDSSGRFLVGTTAVSTSSGQSGEVKSTGTSGFQFTNTTAANYPLSILNEGTSGTRAFINFIEGASGGTARANLSLDGSNNLTVSVATGGFLPGTDNTISLGSTTSRFSGVHAAKLQDGANGELISSTSTTAILAQGSAWTSLNLRTGGSTRLSIDSGGNVIIHDGSVSVQTGSVSTVSFFSSARTAGVGFDQTATAAGIDVGANFQNVSNTSGSGARIRLEVAGASAGDPFIWFNNDAGTNWSVGQDNSDSDALVFSAAATLGTSNVLRITTGGLATLTGTSTSATSPVTAVQNTSASAASGLEIQYTAAAPNNSTTFFMRALDTGATRFEMRTNGGLANFSANDVNLSDARVKAAIEDAPSYWTKLKALRMVTFRYAGQTDDRRHIGMLAQEVDTVAPELVDHSGFGAAADGSPLLAVYQTDVQYVIARALQEAMTRIEHLEQRATLH